MRARVLSVVRWVCAAACLVVSPAASGAADFTLEEGGEGGRACLVRFEGSGPRLTIGLYNVRGDWKLSFGIDRAEYQLRRFFDAKGFVKADAVSDAAQTLAVGGQAFKTTDAMLYAVQRSELSDDTMIWLEIELRRRVAAVVNAMPADEVDVGVTGKLTGLADGLTAFRACVVGVVDMTDGYTDGDQDGEARLIFEDAWRQWVPRRASLSACGFSAPDDPAADLLAEGARAFYPGWGQGAYRDDWVRELTLSASISRMGAAYARLKGECTPLLPALENGWRRVLEEAIELAGN